MGTGTLALPAGEIRRARLLRMLDDAVGSRRLTVLIAGAGFGKTTLLRHWAADTPAAWHSVRPNDRDPGTLAGHLVDALRLRVPDLSAGSVVAASRVRAYADDEVAGAIAMASGLAEALDVATRRPAVLVVDDLHVISGYAAPAALMDALVRHAPALLSVVLASRDQPPFPMARLVAHGEAVEVGAQELAFTPDETLEVVTSACGEPAGDTAVRVHGATSGWPVATRLAAVAMASAGTDGATLLSGFEDPRGLLLRYMADEVVGREDADVLEFLDCAQVLDAVDPEIAKAAGLPEHERLLDRLIRQGVYLEPVAGTRGRVTLRPLFRSYLAQHRGSQTLRHREIMAAASQWHVDHGEAAAGLGYAVKLADGELCTAILTEHGPALTTSGQARIVLDAAALVPTERTAPRIDVLSGDAALMLGQWDDALRSYQKAMAAEPIPAAAWRIGLLHYLRGDLTAAIEVFEAAEIADADLSSRALLLGWWASAQWLRGDRDQCRELAERAYAAAREAADSKALACAHTVLGMLAAIQGDRAANDAHYLSALDHATAAGDVMQLVRIHANRSSQRLEEGDAEGALVEVDLALRLADVAGLATFRALAMSNRGEALLALGRLDEARAELESSQAVFDSLGSSMAAYPGMALGDVHAFRGDRVGAQAAYERAIGLSEAVGDAQGLVPALVGLADLYVSDDPIRARELIDRALASGASLALARALLVAARIQAAIGGDGAADRAREYVHRAAAAAQSQRDKAGLAEASEVMAEITGDKAAALSAVEQWDEVGDPLRCARARLVLARLESPERKAALAERVERDARTLGARQIALAAQALLTEVRTGAEPDEVRLTCFGGLSVSLSGQIQPASVWQSRKARDLLKILICRQGRPVHREEILELLWPGEDVTKTGNRLSVALSTVRAVLDPDRRHPADHYVRADGDAVSLHGASVDVDRFFAHAARGLALARTDAASTAKALLEAAELAYAGDVFEEDPYAEWAVDLREKARMTYLEVVRNLAEIAGRQGDDDARSRYLLRILERDPYDEPAHLELIRLLAAHGRHGEARRRYRLYAKRLSEIDVEPAAYPVSGRGSAARSGEYRSAASE